MLSEKALEGKAAAHSSAFGRCLHMSDIRSRVCRAEAGAAVFETLSEELLEGKVAERLQAHRGATVMPGAIEYTGPDGAPSRLAYGLRDLTVRSSQSAGFETKHECTVERPLGFRACAGRE